MPIIAATRMIASSPIAMIRIAAAMIATHRIAKTNCAAFDRAPRLAARPTRGFGPHNAERGAGRGEKARQPNQGEYKLC